MVDLLKSCVPLTRSAAFFMVVKDHLKTETIALLKIVSKDGSKIGLVFTYNIYPLKNVSQGQLANWGLIRIKGSGR
jgi:hypothetical protein